MSGRAVDHPVRHVHPAGSPGQPRRAALPADRDRLRRPEWLPSLDAGNPLMLAAVTGAGWRRRDLDIGHWPMFSIPKQLAEALDAICRA
jgi:hypothetical protein